MTTLYFYCFLESPLNPHTQNNFIITTNGQHFISMTYVTNSLVIISINTTSNPIRLSTIIHISDNEKGYIIYRRWPSCQKPKLDGLIPGLLAFLLLLTVSGIRAEVVSCCQKGSRTVSAQAQTALPHVPFTHKGICVITNLTSPGANPARNKTSK